MTDGLADEFARPLTTVDLFAKLPSMKTTEIPTVATTEGTLPVYTFAREHGLPVATDPQVGDIVAVFSRGRYRAVKVAKVGPKRLTVVYTTQGALDTAAEIAQISYTAQHDANKANYDAIATRYRAEADMIEALNIEVTEHYPVGDDRRWTPVVNLPVEYKRLAREDLNPRSDRETIIRDPATLREWADAPSRYTDEARAEAQAQDSVPYATRMINATHVTTKSVKREDVYAIV